ncbi:MAG: 2-oxoacid:acceptor oxidoreductase subunit alpha [Caldisericia bacterium]|jgi:2-oxoglutarate ferredoxin oxidoreductase subunit alpha|nr:2-oxoacid:acceptor oxidoreductase subunit alpha [Caldisericia bacterium]HQF37429.1 2-oxoacid:acceptor oxidoreductase subunit alpha [Candidatus Dojkabacteria bacterium]MDD3427374.1 2-oxoacid:acceptor oxidoreductase subunit alpha [Caldisericia bacterium]MDD5688875.1 2-oxoacid:acceptor oxidoreductase subunit alpha [Caldisericia bacterium]HOJ15712.1 2-oxoacid:acceptor oxidoreductase subunit alpha [Caldisericia bacterium]
MIKELWQGSEACAYGAIKAGLSYFAGYPITPSTEIAEILSFLLTKEGKVFIQMEDELASIVSIIGASLAGAKSMTATSGPGFSLMQEGIGYACMVEAPIVVCNVMRGGPSTGLPTKIAQGDVMQSKWGTHGDHPIIVISPDSVKEMYYFTIKAFNLAETYRNPVILLSDEVVAHMRENVEIDDNEDIEITNRKTPTDRENYLPYGNIVDDVPIIANLGDGFGTSITGLVHKESGFQTDEYCVADQLIRRIYRKIDKHKNELFEYEVINGDAETLFVAYGAVSRTVKEIINYYDENKFGLIRLKTIFPFCDDTIFNLTKNAKRVIVVELNLGQLYYEIKRAICNTKPVYLISKVGGELITPEEILKETEAISSESR